MILGFYKQIKGVPTFFKEKILSCVSPQDRVELVVTSCFEVATSTAIHNQLELRCVMVQSKNSMSYAEVKSTFKPKRHTIRADRKKRWKVGMSVQMVYRGKNYSIADHFNKGIAGLEECTSIQKITIKWRRPSWLQKDYGNAIPPFTIKVKNQYVFIYIDDKLIGHKTLRELAINDGFGSITEFLRYFRKSIIDWRIIHYTNTKY